jgi:hypothetical protein
MRNALWCYLYQEKALFAVSNPHKKNAVAAFISRNRTIFDI